MITNKMNSFIYFDYFLQNYSFVSHFSKNIHFTIFEYWRVDEDTLYDFYDQLYCCYHGHETGKPIESIICISLQKQIKDKSLLKKTFIREINHENILSFIQLYHTYYPIYDKIFYQMKQSHFFYICKIESKEHVEKWSNEELYNYYFEQIVINNIAKKYYLKFQTKTRIQCFELENSPFDLNDAIFFKKNIITASNHFFFILSFKNVEDKNISYDQKEQ